jgi:hypothetical protein
MGDSEVAQVGKELAGTRSQQDIGRLDIAMNDTPFVGISQRREKLAEKID